MGIAVGSGNLGMAEHFLNNSQIRAVIEKMGCETMAQGVRGNRFLNPGFQCVFFDHFPNADPIDPLASIRYKKSVPAMPIAVAQ